MKEYIHVRKNRIMLGLIAASAAVVPLAGMAATAGPAGAAKAKGIVCTKTSGKVSGTGTATINLSGCSGNTGGKGTTTGTATSTSGTIKWGNGKSTTISETTSTGTKCTNPATVADEVVNGNVTKDNTKSTKVGAAASGEFCVTQNSKGKLKISGAPGVNFTIAAS
jgi:hypothetical protein